MSTIQKIIPNLWFDNNLKEAADYYLSVFKDGKILNTTYYPETEADGLADFQQEFAGKILTIEFEVLGMRFIGINAGPLFKFNESVSFMIPCKDQNEIDYYWEALTADGGEESVCGWLKDKYGLSWQVCPENWEELNKKPGAFKKMMGMKKLIIDAF
ncbi:Glyoxalase superfamily enzyme, possibly 3-demethylubiquinone-9 3-methyltransferase [Paenimyroides aquimaris]|uniref:Glyoxalase superfamily enzyme, possibly 3-demethylubiquinone-9 3-methyltransferase n=1 Tax=Paenimyroides marinum TaxID=1159016 RepID=A0A1H6L9N8_9FLAO|nr:VOC family protein [Paenimyroides aquimaris]SEH85057.1 Glyoxalase superfamily enzyme, possibly 3-demethylubiquinone-9 3-methyltransferase [Paenimyroides aquimaris]